MSATTQIRFAKSKLTRIQSFIKEHPLESNITAIQYETKLGMLESAFHEFCVCNNETLKTLTDGMKEEHAKYYTSVEEIYLQSNCTLKSYIAARRLDLHSGSVLINFNQPYQIELEPPIFSDDCSEWDSLATSIHSFVKTSTTECPICTGQFHKLYHCQIFKEWDISSRRIFVNQNHYCCNCLLTTHKVTSCKSKYTCHECKQKHHTALHTSKAVQTKCKLKKSQMLNNSGHFTQISSNRENSSSPTTTITATSHTILKRNKIQKMFINPGQFIQSISNQDYRSTTQTTTPACSKSNINTNQLQVMSENSGNNNPQTFNQDFSSSTITNNATTYALKEIVGILPTTDFSSLDPSEILQEVRILFDSASQDSFSSEHCIQPRTHRENARNVSNGTNNAKGAFPGEVQFSRTSVNPDIKITLHSKVQLQISDATINSSQLAKVDITIENNHAMESIVPGLVSTSAGYPIITNSLVDWKYSGIPCNTTLPSSNQKYHTNYVETNLQTNWEREEFTTSATKSTPEDEPNSEFLGEPVVPPNYNLDETFITKVFMPESALEETTKSQLPTSQILQDNSFLLSNTNNRNIDQHKSKFVNSLEKSQFNKTFGLIWNNINKFFYFQVHLSPVSTIQHLIAGLDASEYSTKAFIHAKIFQERLLQIKWDDGQPTTLQIHWTTFVSALHKLEYIKSKRRIIDSNSRKIHFNHITIKRIIGHTENISFSINHCHQSTTISSLHTFFSHHSQIVNTNVYIEERMSQSKRTDNASSSFSTQQV